MLGRRTRHRRAVQQALDLLGSRLLLEEDQERGRVEDGIRLPVSLRPPL
jgi:hypothetical protein